MINNKPLSLNFNCSADETSSDCQYIFYFISLKQRPQEYCNGFNQRVAEQKLGKQTAIENKLFSMRSVPRQNMLAGNAAVNIHPQQWEAMFSVGSVQRSYLKTNWCYNSVLSCEFVAEVNRRPDVCVILTVILKVLQLFVVTTNEDPINRFNDANLRLSHSEMRQYVPALKVRTFCILSTDSIFIIRFSE
jgi:hypothetical protein